VVNLLLTRRKLDLRLADRYGRTPLAWAVLSGNRALLELVSRPDGRPSDLGAFNLRDRLGCSMIHLAAIGNCIDAVAEILSSDQSIYAVDNQDWTALHWAAYLGHKEAAAMLIDRGAKLDCFDKQGWTPYELSVFSGSQQVKELLRGHDNKGQDILEGKKIENGFCSSCRRVSILPSQRRCQLSASEHH